MDLIAIWASIALASLVQGSVGFGFGLVSTALLALFVDVKDASVIMILGGLAQNLTILVRLRRSFTWRGIKGLVIAAVSGVPVGVAFLVRVDSKWVLLVLGCLLILSTLRFHPLGTRLRKLSPALSIPAGLVSGFLHGAFGAGAPPTVLYAKNQAFDRMRYVATLQMVLGMSTLTRAVCLGSYGLITRELATISALGILFAMGGAYLGTRILSVASSTRLEQATKILLALMGASYIMSAV